MQLLKIGGSVITKKHEHMAASQEAIEKLAKTLGKVWHRKNDIILVHGAGSFGHPLVLTYGINDGVKSKKDRIGFAYTHTSCAYLSGLIVEALIRNDVPAISIPPNVMLKQKNKRISEFNEKIVFDYLKAGYMPILYGDMVLDKSIGGSVCSGDQIMAYLGKRAKRIVFGTNVDGVLCNEKVVPKITKKNFGEIKKHLNNMAIPDVTGGMMGKINEIIKIKKPVYIVNALKPERIEALLSGRKTICTEIRL